MQEGPIGMDRANGVEEAAQEHAHSRSVEEMKQSLLQIRTHGQVARLSDDDVHTTFEQQRRQELELDQLLQLRHLPEASGGDTLLHSAVLWGRSDQVQQLLQRHECSAAIHVADGSGNTPLHCAAMIGSAQKLAQLLQQPGVGAVLHRRNHPGFTPLRLAIKARGSTCVKQLLQHSAGPASIPLDDALQVAAKQGLVRILDLLLQHPQARAIHQDVKGCTSLLLASASSPWPGCLERLMQLPPGAASTLKEAAGIALHIALQSGWSGAVKQLLQHHPAAIAVLDCDTHGRNLLHHAVQDRTPHRIELLLSCARGQAASTQRDKQGLVPMDNALFGELPATSQRQLLSAYMSSSHVLKVPLRRISLSDCPAALAWCIANAGPIQDIQQLAEINRQHVDSGRDRQQYRLEVSISVTRDCVDLAVAYNKTSHHWSRACKSIAEVMRLVKWKPGCSDLQKFQPRPQCQHSHSSIMISQQIPLIGCYAASGKSRFDLPQARISMGFNAYDRDAAAQLALGLLEQHLHVESSLRLQVSGEPADGQRVLFCLEHLILTTRGTANGHHGFGHFPFEAEVSVSPGNAAVQAAAAPAESSSNDPVELTSEHGASVTAGANASMVHCFHPVAFQAKHSLNRRCSCLPLSLCKRGTSIAIDARQ